MKKLIHKYIAITLTLISILTLTMGCSGSLKGSEILSQDGIQDRDIISIEVTFLDEDNSLNSPVADLNSDIEDQDIHINEFEDIIKKAKGVSLKNEEKFCPLTDSSHKINVHFDGGTILEFYYYEESNWIIWSQFGETEGENILKYHFLNPKDSFEQWLKSVEPLSTPRE